MNILKFLQLCLSQKVDGCGRFLATILMYPAMERVELCGTSFISLQMHLGRLGCSLSEDVTSCPGKRCIFHLFTFFYSASVISSTSSSRLLNHASVSFNLLLSPSNVSLSIAFFLYTVQRSKWQHTPLCLPGKSHDRGDWQATVCGVTKT